MTPRRRKSFRRGARGGERERELHEAVAGGCCLGAQREQRNRARREKEKFAEGEFLMMPVLCLIVGRDADREGFWDSI